MNRATLYPSGQVPCPLAAFLSRAHRIGLPTYPSGFAPALDPSISEPAPNYSAQTTMLVLPPARDTRNLLRCLKIMVSANSNTYFRSCPHRAVERDLSESFQLLLHPQSLHSWFPDHHSRICGCGPSNSRRSPSREFGPVHLWV